MLDLVEVERPDHVGSIIRAGRTIHTIAVLGSHPATVETAPFHDDGVYIFSCSPHNIQMRTLPRWDAWSEAHSVAADKTRPYDYLRGLEQQAQAKQERGENPIIWMRDREAVKHFPGGVLYPEDEIKATFCPFLLTSSVAWMLALSILEAERNDIKKIALYGILQSSDAEFAYQRPGTQYFLWEATKRGIKVLAARESNLFELPPERW